MANLTFDGLDKYGKGIPKQYYCNRAFKDKYWLREQRKRIKYVTYDGGKYWTYYFTFTIAGLVHSLLAENIVPGAKLPPFGLLVDKDSWGYSNYLFASARKINKTRGADKSEREKFIKDISLAYYSAYRVPLKGYKEVLTNDFVSEAIENEDEIILLKINLEPEYKERNFRLSKGIHFLIEDFIMSDEKYGKEDIINLFTYDVFDIATSFFNYRVTQKERKSFIEILEETAKLVNEWIKTKAITIDYQNTLNDFISQHRFVRKKLKKYMECDKVFEGRKRKAYNPLKEFFCKSFDELVQYLVGKRKIKICKNCNRIIRYQREKYFCTMEDEKRDCKRLYLKRLENRRREARLAEKPSK